MTTITRLPTTPRTSAQSAIQYADQLQPYTGAKLTEFTGQVPTLLNEVIRLISTGQPKDTNAALIALAVAKRRLGG